jgi:hypothetical protein
LGSYGNCGHGGRNNEQSAVMTGEDGKFSFDAPKGKFVLMAEYRGARQPFGQRGPGLGFNVAIFTGPDQDTSNLVFKWYAPGAISGKVLDEHNEPVEGALVQLIRVNVAAGRKTRATAARACHRRLVSLWPTRGGTAIWPSREAVAFEGARNWGAGRRRSACAVLRACLLSECG